MQQGVPAKAIRVLEPPILNTADEIVAIKGALNAAPLHIVIIVTTKPHTRRTRTLWRMLTHDESRAIVRAASTDPFDARSLVAQHARCAGCGQRSLGLDERLGRLAAGSQPSAL